MALKENYKDDILDVSVNTKRKYRMTENADGTISLDDETVYTQEGDSFGASDMNALAHAVNNIATDAEHTSYDNATSGLQATNVQDAVDELNDNLAQTPITVGGQTLSTIDEKINYIAENINAEVELYNVAYLTRGSSASSRSWNVNPNKTVYFTVFKVSTEGSYMTVMLKNGVFTIIESTGNVASTTTYTYNQGILTITNTNPSNYFDEIAVVAY